MTDVYFDQTYGRLYEKIEGGKCEVFEFCHPFGVIRHVFIRKEIPILVDGEKYYDIVTPSAYGGPIILESVKVDKCKLINEFQKAFYQYCKKNKIVSELVHFHPVLKNSIEFKDIYNIEYIGETLGTNLASYRDPIHEEFSDTSREIIDKCLEKGVKYRVIVNPYNLKYYKEIYLSLVASNKVKNNHLFNEDYFSLCFAVARRNIVIVEAIYEEQIIGISLNYYSNNMLQSQLSATLPEFNFLAPNYILQYGLTIWGKKNGIAYIHNGGGSTIGTVDKLYKYKKNFGKNTCFDYYIGTKIWNKEIYKKLCKMEGVGISAECFPAYRIKEYLIAEGNYSKKNQKQSSI